MRVALAAHDEVLRTAIEAYDGFLFSHTGDGFVAAFASPISRLTWTATEPARLANPTDQLRSME
jgi:class 3 adenylate cyclase